MNKRIFLLASALLFGLTILFAQNRTNNSDEQICKHILAELQQHNNKPTAELVVDAAKLLMNTPYVAHTLETEPEQLIVNLRELDCTTFAENCLALARTAKTRKPSYKHFKNELQFIRYRGGEISGYPSRLHYFSDWILDNDKKHTVKSISQSIGNIEFDKTINFMSQHPNSYKQLKNNAVFIEALNKQEQELTNAKLYYLPTEKLETLKHQIKNGDIFGITTTVDGLDITHVGIAAFKGDELHFLHASSKAGKVILSEETLVEYLLNRKPSTGIMIARPL
ncbi:N-acetylmuramoyl-L-alanine amidase-like domain-containing protein [uncultured Draconibacterium sp.]|uniref:N-acetylmuramoyl-L-alanine amidase-like domain-containing protein n=1 Tax=uncultured Draconibacterium sp. TaxID=1573823 RepID=UPI0029C82E08|nr:N-acetylmuramoyl-L-alanine amidase-like domain-containing protein [uncultured Draconibacterium sp.]